MKKINWLNMIFSILLSISLNLKFVIDNDLNFFIKKFHINMFFVLKVFILSIFIYFTLKLLFFLLDCLKIKKKYVNFTLKYELLIFMGIFISSFLFLIVHYPAVYLNDSIFLMYDPILLSEIHPLFYGMFMSLSFFSLKSLVGASASVFIMSIVQTIISSFILTYTVSWFHRKHKCNLFTLLLFLYYMCVPIVSSYNIALNKDTPFSLLFLLFTILLYELIETMGNILASKRYFVYLFLISILMIYTRNNGIYIVLFSLSFLFFFYGFEKYKRKCVVFFTMIFLFSLIPWQVMKIWNVHYLQREKYAIPLQQIGYIVKYYPNHFSEKEYGFLSNIIKDAKKTISDNYHLFEVDSIKYHEDFNSIKFNEYEMDFFHLWMNHLSSDFTSYVKSYLLHTYDLWSLNRFNHNQSVFERASISLVPKERKIYNKAILPKPIQKILKHYYDISLVYLNPAFCFVFLMIVNLYAFSKKKKKCFFISIPLICLWFVLMISTPLASALRYMAPYIYVLPIILLNTIYFTRKENIL